MKTTARLLLTTLLSLIFLGAFGQSASMQKSEQEVRSLLCHKWKPVSLKENGVTMPMEKEDSALYIIFLNDGSFVDYLEGDSPSGKWTYAHKTMTLSMGHEAKIVRIDGKQLILTSKSEGVNATLVLNRAD